MKLPQWDERIRRSRQLSESHGPARDILQFYQHVARLQSDLDRNLSQDTAPDEDANSSWPHTPDIARLLPAFPSFLERVACVAPRPLAEFAARWQGESPQIWKESLTRYWRNPESSDSAMRAAETFCARAFLQPYAESLARRRTSPSNGSAARVCPCCGRRPQVGVLRPEGDGGKKSLICSLCSTEWEFRRILCAACGEENEKSLCVYAAEGFGHIRVEACDTCKTYIDSVDLTRDGHAVPIVDELAAVPLSLWAAEKGYAKLQPNLLGM